MSREPLLRSLLPRPRRKINLLKLEVTFMVGQFASLIIVIARDDLFKHHSVGFPVKCDNGFVSVASLCLWKCHHGVWKTIPHWCDWSCIYVKWSSRVTLFIFSFSWWNFCSSFGFWCFLAFCLSSFFMFPCILSVLIVYGCKTHMAKFTKYGHSKILGCVFCLFTFHTGNDSKSTTKLKLTFFKAKCNAQELWPPLKKQMSPSAKPLDFIWMKEIFVQQSLLATPQGKKSIDSICMVKKVSKQV